MYLAACFSSMSGQFCLAMIYESVRCTCSWAKIPMWRQTSCPCIPKKAHVFNSYLPFLVSDLILQENRRVDIVILGMNAVECMMVLHGFHPVTFSVKCYLIFSFRFVDTCMDQVNQGMNKEEAIENTVKMLFASNVTTMPVSEILHIL